MTREPSAAQSDEREPGSGSGLKFGKSSRLLKRAEFQMVYEKGSRLPSRSFVAFCLDAGGGPGPKIGFTASKAIGGAVDRNRIKRRVRETIRRALPRMAPNWRIVINLRRAALTVPQAGLIEEVERLVERCA